MNITFRDLFTKEVVMKKRSETVPHLPRTGEALKMSDGRTARVMDVEYHLSAEKEFAYEMIDVIVQVFAKDEVTAQYPNQATKS